MRTLFEDADVDGNGVVSWQNFEAQLHTQAMKDAVHDIHQAHTEPTKQTVLNLEW